MRKSETLVMPLNYVVMTEEEMCYLEGGWIGLPNWLVENIINFAISSIVGGGYAAAKKYFSGQVSKYGVKAAGLCFSETLRKKLIAKGVTNRLAGGICGIAAGGITVLTWALNPGKELAKYIDAHDSTGKNGWCTVG